MPDISPDQIEHMLSMNEWVRPVCTTMRAVSIPEPVVQKAMFYLLSELDAHTKTPKPRRATTQEKLVRMLRD